MASDDPQSASASPFHDLPHYHVPPADLKHGSEIGKRRWGYAITDIAAFLLGIFHIPVFLIWALIATLTWIMSSPPPGHSVAGHREDMTALCINVAITGLVSLEWVVSIGMSSSRRWARALAVIIGVLSAGLALWILKIDTDMGFEGDTKKLYLLHSGWISAAFAVVLALAVLGTFPTRRR